jgi:cell division protein FtsW (lipid II flippase)
LTFAVDITTSGFNLNTVGIILMVAGALGLVLSLLFEATFSPYRRGRTVAFSDMVVEERRIERDLP